MAWLTDWTYRKSITLSRASGAVTNYQMLLPVGESSGATGESVDCGGNCAADFDDIRFTTSDGETLLDYWIESVSGTTPNQLANFWIEFDSIGTGATTFYMYYGNAGAAAYSNGENTFPFFDHFDGDLSKWTVNYGTPAIASSIVTFNGTQYERITTTATFGTNYAFRAEVGMDSSNAGGITFNEHHGLSNYTDGSGKFSMRTYRTDWGAQTSTDISNRISGSNVLELRRNASTGVIGVINNWVAATHTSNFVTVDAGGRIGLGQTAGTFTSDWALIRQFLATEPEWGSWGEEESSSELEDASLDLTVWASSTDDLRLWMEATGWDLTDLSVEFSAYYQSLQDLGAHLQAIGQELENALLELNTWGYGLDDLGVYFVTGAYELADICCLLQAVSSTVFGDMLMYLSATDGTVTGDMGLQLSALRRSPAFKSIIAHRLTSVVSEVT